MMTAEQPGHTFTGDVFAPRSHRFDGLRPTAAVMHGIDASPCSIRWIDRLLASKGYVVIDVYRLPTPRHTTAHDNPVLSVLQSQLPNVQAVVAMDNLKRYGANDHGSALICSGVQSLQAVPKVPALGFASDAQCKDTPAGTPIDPEEKKPGYEWWRQFKQPTMELVLRGFTHPDFSDGGSNAQLTIVAYYMVAWLARRPLDPVPLVAVSAGPGRLRGSVDELYLGCDGGDTVAPCALGFLLHRACVFRVLLRRFRAG